MECMEDFMKFGRHILRVESSKETYDGLVSWLSELTTGKDFIRFLSSSNLINLVLDFYNSDEEMVKDCGMRMIEHVVNSSYRLSKDSIPIFLELSFSLKRAAHPLYYRLRNNLCKRVCLFEDGVKQMILKEFVREFLEETLNGCKRYLESKVIIGDGSYLEGVEILRSLGPHLSHEVMSNVLTVCKSMLPMFDALLDKDVEDFDDRQSFLIFLHHLNLFNSLSRFVGMEGCISSTIEAKCDCILKFAVKAVRMNLVMSMPRLIDPYLQHGNLMDRFLQQLLMEINSILGGRVNKENMIQFELILSLCKKIAKNVPSGEEDIKTFMESRSEDIGIMSTLLEIFEEDFCSDKDLLRLDRSISKVEPEFRLHFLLTVVPKVDDNSTWIVEVTRDNLADKSLKSILAASGSQLRGKKLVRFAGEDGGGPGVIREWILLQFEGMLAMGNYFETLQQDRRILMPTRENVQDVNFFIYFGRLLALSLMHHVQGGFMLEPIVIKMLADVEVTLIDVMDLSSTTGDESYSENVPLADTQLTEDFIDEYFNDLVGEKVENIKKGIDDIFGSERRRTFFSILHACDLKTVISGEPAEISIEDWVLHTEYNRSERNDVQVSWFWKIVGKFSAEQKRELLCFWMSVKYLPPGGFRNLEFHPLLHIYQTDAEDAVPTAGTCGYQLNLPLYDSYDILEDRLHYILPFCLGFAVY